MHEAYTICLSLPEMSSEMVNDAIDDAMDDEEMEEETDDLIGQVRLGEGGIACGPAGIL